MSLDHYKRMGFGKRNSGAPIKTNWGAAGVISKAKFAIQFAQGNEHLLADNIPSPSNDLAVKPSSKSLFTTGSPLQIYKEKT